MPNPPADITDLVLQGSPNLRRGLKRAENEKEPLTLDQEQTIEKIELLIATALDRCTRGQTIDGKKNPAFENLKVLLQCKALVIADKSAKKNKSVAKLLAEAELALSKRNN